MRSQQKQVAAAPSRGQQVRNSYRTRPYTAKPAIRGFALAQSRFGRSDQTSGSQYANSLQLHSPQLGHAVSVFFDTKKGSTPGGMMVSGRELSATAITATNAGGAFVNTAILIQCAATALTARWGTFSALYQKWRIRSLRATFVSNQPTTVVGNVYAGTVGVLQAAAPTTGAGIMRENGAVFGNAYSDLVTEYDCKSQIVPWFATTATSETAVAGYLNVGTDGFSSAVVPGQIVVDYEIEFADPV